MYGTFLEDINYSGEGGLIPEMLRDRSFEGYAYLASHPNKAVKRSPAKGPLARVVNSTLQSLSMDPAGGACMGLHGPAWACMGLHALQSFSMNPAGQPALACMSCAGCMGSMNCM